MLNSTYQITWKNQKKTYYWKITLSFFGFFYMFWFKSQELLEQNLEQRMKQAYKEWDIIRCYNLMKLMAKINQDNAVLLEYLWKIDKKKLEAHRRKRAISSSVVWSFILSPRLYIWVILLYLTWRLK